jgi:four helix bundle protein
MEKQDLFARTRLLAIRVFKICERFPRSDATKVVTNQLLRASSSVAANYRSLKRAKSRADFGNKLKIVLEECDECNFWLTFVGDIGLLSDEDPELKYLTNESDQLTAIFTASLITLKDNTRSQQFSS